MMKRLAIVTALALFATMAVGSSASAEQAIVVQWSDTLTGQINSWTNPCTGEPVVLVSNVEVGGVAVRDGNGDIHGYQYTNVIDGAEYERVAIDVPGDPTGWIIVDLHVNSVSDFIEDPETGAAYFLWQLSLTVENPDTGEQYKALFQPHYVVSATGELVVEPGPWGPTLHNTCLGIPG